MTLTANIALNVQATAVGTAAGFSAGAPNDPISAILSAYLTSGTAVNQADQYYAPAQLSIASAGTVDIDLNGGSTNGIGGTVSMARGKLIIIQLVTTTAGYYIKMGLGSNPITTIMGGTTPYLNIMAGGFACLYAPDATAYAITAGTADILRITNPNAGTVAVNVLIIGASV